jgi:hypothetical protein
MDCSLLMDESQSKKAAAGFLSFSEAPPKKILAVNAECTLVAIFIHIFWSVTINACGVNLNNGKMCEICPLLTHIKQRRLYP